MRYSELSNRVSGQGSTVWDNHYKAVARQAAGDDVIVMSVGDPDFATPPIVTQAAINALNNGDTHYTEVTGRSRLRKAVADKIGRINDIKLLESHVAITAGTQNALYASAALLLDPGDEVLVLEPMFTTYYATIQSTGAKLIPIACPGTDGYQPDIKLLLNSVNDKTKAIFFASPANPTGAMLEPNKLKAIADIAINNDLWVVSDEIYCDFIFDGHHHSISSIPGMQQRTVIVGSLSKSHAMTGWRIGWAIGPSAFVEAFSNLNLAVTYGLPGFIQEAGATALEQELSEVKEMKDEFQRRRDLAIAVLSTSKILKPSSPPAGMFLMLDITSTNMSGLDFSQGLYQALGVSVLDGSEFGASGRGFIRISLATNIENIKKGCDRIIQYAESIQTV